jgi:hypothetical protein
VHVVRSVGGCGVGSGGGVGSGVGVGKRGIGGCDAGGGDVRIDDTAATIVIVNVVVNGSGRGRS